MNAELQKDEPIIHLIEKLKVRLGVASFHVVDHWEADLCAIGIAHPDNNGVLVYVCTHGQSNGTYFVSLELPPETGSDLPFASAGEDKDVNFDELVEIIQKHFSKL